MVIILKHNPKAAFSPVYMVDNGIVTPIGVFDYTAITGVLQEKKMLDPIDQAVFIETFFFSPVLMDQVSKHEYYYVGA